MNRGPMSSLRTMFVVAGLGAVLLSGSRAQQPQLPPPVPKPNLPDLDVICIERTPKYPPGGDFKYTDDGQCIRAKEEPPVKHWPDPGEEVTFIAHIVNKGGAPSKEVNYWWMLDGEAKADPGWGGTLKPLEPGEETKVELKWKWSPDPHRILFIADPENKLYEICERNNCREDQTNAKALQMRVTESIHAAFAERLNAIGSYSFEDWCQEQVRILNEMLAAAVWPSTPKGCLERVRIDDYRIMTQDEMNQKPPQIFGDDGGWNYFDGNFPAWTSFAMSVNFVSTVDWGLVHELAHQIGLIDVYGVETTSVWKDETDPKSQEMTISFRSRQGSIMGTYVSIDNLGRPKFADLIGIEPDTHVVQGPGLGRDGFSEWDAAGLNAMLTMRRGHFGLYIADLAKNNLIRVLDRTGKPVAGAAVATFPQELPSRKTARKPRFTGKTDSAGLVNLGAHPFGGTVSCLGISGLLFVRISHPSLAMPEYHWLEIGEYNIAFWRDGGKRAVLDVMTGIGGPGAPKPPAGVDLETTTKAPGLLVGWQPSLSKGVVSYRVYAPSPTTMLATPVPNPSRERPYGMLIKDVPASQRPLQLTLEVAKGTAFAVTAVDRKGRESSDAASTLPAQVVGK